MITRITMHNRVQPQKTNFKGAIKVPNDDCLAINSFVQLFTKENKSLEDPTYFSTLFPKNSPLEAIAKEFLEIHDVRFAHYTDPDMTEQDFEKFHRFVELG